MSFDDGLEIITKLELNQMLGLTDPRKLRLRLLPIRALHNPCPASYLATQHNAGSATLSAAASVERSGTYLGHERLGTGALTPTLAGGQILHYRGSESATMPPQWASFVPGQTYLRNQGKRPDRERENSPK